MKKQYKLIHPIKVKFISGEHSVGRGVGFYAANLAKALKKVADIELVDENPDIIHYPFFDLFYPTLPWTKPKPTIVTLHDLTPLVLADKYPKGIRGTINLIRQRVSLINVAAIITDSQHSKKDLVKIFKLNPDKIFVTLVSYDPAFGGKVAHSFIDKVKKKYQLPDKFVLCVPGHPNANKNLPLLAQATQELAIPLVLIGGGMVQKLPDKIHPELRDLVALQSFDHLILPGFVPTDELVAIYKLATLYCQPSLYEGFGIPLLEAQAAGCLLVSSNSSSLPELYAPGTIDFDPKSLIGLKGALLKALSLSPAQKVKMIEAGFKKVNQFSWNKTAAATAEVYRLVSADNSQVDDFNT